MLVTLLRRAGWVAIGIALGQCIVLLVTPYLARHFTPAQFGVLALLTTVSNLSASVACLRYDLALPSSGESETRGLLVTSFIVAGSMAVFAFSAIAFAKAGRLTAYAGALTQRPMLVGTCVLLVGLHQATCAWLLRKGAYRNVAGMRFSQGAGFSLVALIPGVGLLWAHVISFGAGVIGLRPLLAPKKDSEITWLEAFRLYRQFPILNLPGAVLDVCGYSLSIWVIATNYGPALAGNYSQIQRLTGAPLMLISISLSQILLRQTAEIKEDKQEFMLFLTGILKMMATLATAGIIFLWVFGEPIFARLLGSQWKVDRELIVVVAIAVFFRACISPLSTILITLRRFKFALAWQVIYFCSASLLMPFFASRISFEHYAAFYALHEAILYSFYLLLIRRAVHIGEPA